MKKLALYMSSTHMPQKADWLSCVTVAADAGFDGLELFGARYAREADMTPDQLDAIARVARARNLPLAALFPRLDRLCDDCARLGEREVVLHMDFLSHRQNGGMERLFAAIDRMYPILQREGMTLMMENVPTHGIRELGSETEDFTQLFARYTDETGPVQMNIDSGHAYIMNMAEMSRLARARLTLRPLPPVPRRRAIRGR